MGILWPSAGAARECGVRGVVGARGLFMFLAGNPGLDADACGLILVSAAFRSL